MKIEKILFPTDFSEGSYNAVPYAVDFSRQYNAKLYIVHIIYDFTKATYSHIPHISSDQVVDDITVWAENEIDKCYREQIRGLSGVDKLVLNGVPHEEKVKFAEDRKIDIIVMGTYGRTGLDKLIFGSTAERVVRKAPCPVLAVKQPEYQKK
ncbi:MAG TPA: universal stress protein [bacterium]|nr:universal stress protein [bacterium]